MKVLSLKPVLTLTFISLNFGCAQTANFAATPDSKASLNSEAPPTLSPTASQLGYSAHLNLQASDGTPPYSFSKIQGAGGSLTVNSDGLGVQFLSPSSDETVVIQVEDANGKTATAQIIVQAVQNSSGSIQGLVTNATDGSSLAGVQVVVHSGSATAGIVTTDSVGHYLLAGLATGSYTLDFSLSNYVSITGVPATVQDGQVSTINESLSTILTAGQIRIVMSWCSAKNGAVRDVDSYLTIPGFSNPISFRTHTEGNSQLDHDVTTWNGPETITINSVSNGTYAYYVNNYNNRGDNSALGNSNVHVNVFKGSSLIKSYDVPSGFGISYEVFHIVNGTIVDVNAFNSQLFHW